MSTLLLFNISPPYRAALQVIALRCRCRVRAVEPSRFGDTLETLLSGGAESGPGAAGFTEPMLVMSGLEEGQMDLLLSELRRKRIAIPLKAVVTPTNRRWTAQALYAELCRERDAFAAGKQAHEG